MKGCESERFDDGVAFVRETAVENLGPMQLVESSRVKTNRTHKLVFKDVQYEFEYTFLHYESNQWYNVRGFLKNVRSSQPQTFNRPNKIVGSFLSLNDWCLRVQIDP